MPKRSRVTLATVRRLSLGFPGVEEGLSYGTPGFRVRGKFLARLWEDGVTLVVKCGDDERDFRMKADPETFFITDHYRGYPTVLVRLARVTEADLQDVLEQAWRLQAPRRLVKEYDQARR
ncbi:MAG TPA: MmcQ/YjbR family DNA-binding protein [Gemmatimonadales bacterium]|nr:MmcQ/YjbR family DNA-binding protein [Gemmatimonadales bacterium]